MDAGDGFAREDRAGCRRMVMRGSWASRACAADLTECLSMERAQHVRYLGRAGLGGAFTRTNNADVIVRAQAR